MNSGIYAVVKRYEQNGKEFTEPPATSRKDNSAICPLCGNREALEVAVEFGAMSKEEADEIINKLSQLENK